MDSDKPTRVAVVGTGLAGLATAYQLCSSAHKHDDGSPLRLDVYLFERNDELGMDAASLSIKIEDGASVRVDVPMRSINGGSHSRVKRLYDRLGVPLVESDFSYSFSSMLAPTPTAPSPPPSASPAPPASASHSSDSVPSTPPPSYTETASPAAPAPRSTKTSLPPRPFQTTQLLYSGSSGLSWPPLPFPSHLSSLSSQLSHLCPSLLLTLSYLYLLLLSFFYVSLGLSRPPPPRRARSLLANARRRALQRFSVAAEPLDEFSARHRMPGKMKELLRVLMGAVATVGVEDAGKMPVGEILEYITSTFAAPHYVTSPSFGVRGIVAALVKPVPKENIHLGVTISCVEAKEGGYRVVYSFEKGEETQEDSLNVAHVVFATQADQAALLLSTLSATSSPPPPAPSPFSLSPLYRTLAALRTFTYARTLVVTHTDTSLLPPSPADRRDLNLAVFSSPLSTSSPPTPHPSSQAEEAQEEDEGDTLPPSSVQTTHILRLSPPSPRNKPYQDLPPPSTIYLQTTNPLVPVDPARVLRKTWFSRAVVNAESQAVVPLFDTGLREEEGGLQGLSLGQKKVGGRRGEEGGGFWFAGSYLAPGIPLLEGCVVSAEEVAEGILARERARRRREKKLVSKYMS
ncbi:hypothetical protein JCM8547_008976 [Rhodosporidiobolus lusitaniae]